MSFKDKGARTAARSRYATASLSNRHEERSVILPVSTSPENNASTLFQERVTKCPAAASASLNRFFKIFGQWHLTSPSSCGVRGERIKTKAGGLRHEA
jgi:hypothetical protein